MVGGRLAGFPNKGRWWLRLLYTHTYRTLRLSPMERQLLRFVHTSTQKKYQYKEVLIIPISEWWRNDFNRKLMFLSAGIKEKTRLNSSKWITYKKISNWNLQQYTDSRNKIRRKLLLPSSGYIKPVMCRQNAILSTLNKTSYAKCCLNSDLALNVNV